MTGSSSNQAEFCPYCGESIPPWYRPVSTTGSDELQVYAPDFDGMLFVCRECDEAGVVLETKEELQ